MIDKDGKCHLQAYDMLFDQNHSISVNLTIGPYRNMLCPPISRHFFEKHLFPLSQEIPGFN